VIAEEAAGTLELEKVSRVGAGAGSGALTRAVCWERQVVAGSVARRRREGVRKNLITSGHRGHGEEWLEGSNLGHRIGKVARAGVTARRNDFAWESCWVRMSRTKNAAPGGEGGLMEDGDEGLAAASAEMYSARL